MKIKVEYIKGQWPKKETSFNLEWEGLARMVEVKKKLSLGSIDRGAEELTNKVTKIKIT